MYLPVCLYLFISLSPSSNIMLDHHLVPKLGDFGLGVFSMQSGGVGVRTSSVGRTSVLRVAQAYQPQDFLQDRRRTPGLDVFSFGVVRDYASIHQLTLHPATLKPSRVGSRTYTLLHLLYILLHLLYILLHLIYTLLHLTLHPATLYIHPLYTLLHLIHTLLHPLYTLLHR